MSLNKGVMIMACGGKDNLIEFSFVDVWGTNFEDLGHDSTSPYVPYKAEKGMTWEQFLNSKYYYVPNGEITKIEIAPNWIMEGPDDEMITRTNTIRIHRTEKYDYINDIYFSKEDYWNYNPIVATDEIVANHHYYAPCYIKGTLITLSDGSKKSVETITYDDELLVWDFDNGCFTSAKPLWVKRVQTSSYYYRLKFEDGTEICLVGQDGKCHRLYNVERQEFISGTDFHVGEHTFNEQGIEVKLIGIEIIEKEVEYYNIITDYYMNCFANGLLTSTQYNNVYPIENMKFVKDNRKPIPIEDYEGIPTKFYDGMRLGEQDLKLRSIEKTNAYISRMIALME